MAKMMDRPVVVGMDGSANAEHALAYAAWEAIRRGVPLRLVYGHQPTPPYDHGLTYADTDQLSMTWALDMVAATAERIRTEYPNLVEVTQDVIFGSPAATLVDLSANASLVVLGSRSRDGFVGMLLGSVGAQVAAHAHAPVVIVRPAAGSNSAYDDGPIVVGVDGSDGAQDALEFAFEQAAARDVPLFAVYAWNRLPKANLGPISDSHFDYYQAQDEAERLLAEAIAGWRAKYPDVEVNASATHSYNPVRTLTDLSGHAGMIVVGPRGRGGFAALLLGSVADGVVRHAARTVAVVHHMS